MIRHTLYNLLRWSERYTKTDMVYLATSGFWVNANFWLVSLLSFGLSIAFANWLTKETYGTYQYLLSLFALLGAFTLSGMSTALTQSIARGHEATLRAVLRPQLLWNLGAGGIGFAMSAYYFYRGNAELGIGLLIIGAALPLYHSLNSYSALYVGRKDFRTTFFYALLINIPYYVCIFLGIYFLREALALLFINLFVNTLGIAINYWRTVRKVRNSSVDPEAVGYGKHLTYMNVLGALIGQADSLFVFHFLGAAELATYTLIKLIPERLGGLFKSVTMPAFPKFAMRSAEDVRSGILHKTAMLGFGLLACIIAYVFIAPWFFALVYPRYTDAIPFTQLYALTLLGVGANLAMNALTAHKKKTELYVLNTAVPIAQLFVQMIGVVTWGLLGLVIAKIVSALLSVGASITAVMLSKEEGGMNQNTRDA